MSYYNYYINNSSTVHFAIMDTPVYTGQNQGYSISFDTPSFPLLFMDGSVPYRCNTINVPPTLTSSDVYQEVAAWAEMGVAISPGIDQPIQTDINNDYVYFYKDGEGVAHQLIFSISGNILNIDAPEAPVHSWQINNNTSGDIVIKVKTFGQWVDTTINHGTNDSVIWYPYSQIQLFWTTNDDKHLFYQDDISKALVWNDDSNPLQDLIADKNAFPNVSQNFNTASQVLPGFSGPRGEKLLIRNGDVDHRPIDCLQWGITDNAISIDGADTVYSEHLNFTNNTGMKLYIDLLVGPDLEIGNTVISDGTSTYIGNYTGTINTEVVLYETGRFAVRLANRFGVFSLSGSNVHVDVNIETMIAGSPLPDGYNNESEPGHFIFNGHTGIYLELTDTYYTTLPVGTVLSDTFGLTLIMGSDAVSTLTGNSSHYLIQANSLLWTETDDIKDYDYADSVKVVGRPLMINSSIADYGKAVNNNFQSDFLLDDWKFPSDNVENTATSLPAEDFTLILPIDNGNMYYNIYAQWLFGECGYENSLGYVHSDDPNRLRLFFPRCNSVDTGRQLENTRPLIAGDQIALPYGVNGGSSDFISSSMITHNFDFPPGVNVQFAIVPNYWQLHFSRLMATYLNEGALQTYQRSSFNPVGLVKSSHHDTLGNANTVIGSAHVRGYGGLPAITQANYVVQFEDDIDMDFNDAAIGVKVRICGDLFTGDQVAIMGAGDSSHGLGIVLQTEAGPLYPIGDGMSGPAGRITYQSSSADGNVFSGTLRMAIRTLYGADAGSATPKPMFCDDSNVWVNLYLDGRGMNLGMITLAYSADSCPTPGFYVSNRHSNVLPEDVMTFVHSNVQVSRFQLEYDHSQVQTIFTDASTRHFTKFRVKFVDITYTETTDDNPNYGQTLYLRWDGTEATSLNPVTIATTTNVDLATLFYGQP